MSKNSIIDENGINIIRLIQKIWKEKFKIFLSMFLSLVIVYSFTQSFLTKNFTATTEIKSITQSEIDEFLSLEILIDSLSASLKLK